MQTSPPQVASIRDVDGRDVAVAADDEGVVHSFEIRPSIPNVCLVVFNLVLGEEHSELVLESSVPVVLLLSIDVGAEGIQISRPHGEAAITALPREAAKVGRLSF